MTVKTYNGPMQGLVYVVKDKKTLCVDASVCPKEKIDLLVLTHCHFDHLLAINEIIARDKPEILASIKAAKHLAKLDTATMCNYAPHIKPIKVTKKLKDKDKIKVGKYTLEVITTPGHTDGGICLYEPKEQWLFSGDTIFSGGGIGRLDCPTGDIMAIKKSLAKLGKLTVKKLFPGHSY
jgi:glyoxylase-like metal-dependent hydrolase (beta-lactamase superfamily II)